MCSLGTFPIIQVMSNKQDSSIQATSVALWSCSDACCRCFCHWTSQHGHPDIFVRTRSNLLSSLSYNSSPLGSDTCSSLHSSLASLVTLFSVHRFTNYFLTKLLTCFLMLVSLLFWKTIDHLKSIYLALIHQSTVLTPLFMSTSVHMITL